METEHCIIAALLAVIFCLTYLLFVKSPRTIRLLSDHELIHAVRAVKHAAGPRSVFSWGLVSEAPQPSMDISKLDKGQAVSHSDSRGDIYRFKLGPGLLVNMYHTKAGYRRSGDLHDCTQYDVVLAGRVRLRLLDPNTGKEVVRDYEANDFIVIPARTPHMFEFIEDNYLLEWWDDDFRAWYYKPYRDIIDQGLALSIQDTQAMDFSIKPSSNAERKLD